MRFQHGSHTEINPRIHPGIRTEGIQSWICHWNSPAATLYPLLSLLPVETKWDQRRWHRIPRTVRLDPCPFPTPIPCVTGLELPDPESDEDREDEDGSDDGHSDHHGEIPARRRLWETWDSEEGNSHLGIPNSQFPHSQPHPKQRSRAPAFRDGPPCTGTAPTPPAAP